MCAKSYRPRPGEDEDHYEDVRPSWKDIGEWIRAWRNVMRDPDKSMPESGIGPEGDPIPDELDLRCPHCGYDVGGLTRWRCPECGETFNPRRCYTVQMLKQPEYFLRYRYAPEDIRLAAFSVVLSLIGFIMVSSGVFIANRSTAGAGTISVAFGLGALSAFSCLACPTLILLHLAVDIPLPRVLLYFALPWFALCLLLFAGFVF